MTSSHPVRTDKWVVFSTFESLGRPDPCAVDQLRAYRACGFQTLVVDTSPTASAARRGDWQREATRWFPRQNVGYDFASYAVGLRHLVDEAGVALGNLDLVIANDSCFGPFTSIGELIEGFDREPSDAKTVYGITDSWMQGHHIQSYWLYFRAGASQAACDFLGSMRPARNRDEAIAFGELALGAYLRSAGFRIVVSCPVQATLSQLARFNGTVPSALEFAARRLLKRWKYNRDADTQCLRLLLNYPDKMQYFNPAVLLGVQLYQKKLSPFVKRSVLRDNLYAAPNLPSGLDVHALSNGDVGRILDAA